MVKLLDTIKEICKTIIKALRIKSKADKENRPNITQNGNNNTVNNSRNNHITINKTKNDYNYQINNGTSNLPVNKPKTNYKYYLFLCIIVIILILVQFRLLTVYCVWAICFIALVIDCFLYKKQRPSTKEKVQNVLIKIFMVLLPFSWFIPSIHQLPINNYMSALAYVKYICTVGITNNFQLDIIVLASYILSLITWLFALYFLLIDYKKSSCCFFLTFAYFLGITGLLYLVIGITNLAQWITSWFSSQLTELSFIFFF